MESCPMSSLTEDLVAEIFLRVPSLDDLARIAMANDYCHHIITDPYFVRRVPSYRYPSFLGFLTRDGFHPVQPPHPSASISHALVAASDLSFSFLPLSGSWIVQDICDGRVILSRSHGSKGDKGSIFMHLAVCDPVSRSYVLLPPLPDDLYTAVQDLCHEGFNYKCETFLVPRGECAVVETSFKVIWMARGYKKLLVLIFSSVVGKWHAVTSLDGQHTGEVISFSRRVHSRRSYAYGCFYWKMGEAGKVLALDTRKMELFFSNIPLGYLEYDCAMVEAGKGRLGIFALFHHMAGTRLHLYYTTKKSEVDSTNEWSLEKTIQLPPTEHDYRILCATNGYLFMRCCRDSSYENINYGYILMDMKTFLFERFCKTNRPFPFPTPYFGFPPSLSPPSI